MCMHPQKGNAKHVNATRRYTIVHFVAQRDLLPYCLTFWEGYTDLSVSQPSSKWACSPPSALGRQRTTTPQVRFRPRKHAAMPPPVEMKTVHLPCPRTRYSMCKVHALLTSLLQRSAPCSRPRSSKQNPSSRFSTHKNPCQQQCHPWQISWAGHQGW